MNTKIYVKIENTTSLVRLSKLGYTQEQWDNLSEEAQKTFILSWLISANELSIQWSY